MLGRIELIRRAQAEPAALRCLLALSMVCFGCGIAAAPGHQCVVHQPAAADTALGDNLSVESTDVLAISLSAALQVAEEGLERRQGKATGVVPFRRMVVRGPGRVSQPPDCAPMQA